MIESVIIHPVCRDTILELIDAMNIDSCDCIPCENWKSIRAKLIAAQGLGVVVRQVEPHSQTLTLK